MVKPNGAMMSAKIFQHGGSQAVRLPRAFRFHGTEVRIEKQRDDVLLKPVPAQKFRSFTEIARHLAEKFPDAADFPTPPPRPKKHDRRALA
jgi:antitoxin VapB